MLTLEDSRDEDVERARAALRSPLGLAEVLLKIAFSNDADSTLLQYYGELDDIKHKAMGLGGASTLAEGGSKIANYAGYLFAFQQFFHSSYRARQGNVLEEVLEIVLRQYVGSIHSNTSQVEDDFGFGNEILSSDVDLIYELDNRYLLSMIRSRGDTGGTTAKESLAKPLDEILSKAREIPQTLYTVLVWEGEQQRRSLLRLFWSRIEHHFSRPDRFRDDYLEHIERGWHVPGRDVEVRIVFGMDEFVNLLDDFTGNSEIGQELLETWALLEQWDDLWLVYALSSIELENTLLRGRSNFDLLERTLSEGSLNITQSDLENYEESSKRIAHNLSLLWSEDTLPVKAPQESQNYLRDLILCRMAYLKLTS